LEVYLEIGKTRTFAIAIDWPGWCRSGRDAASALQTLIDYGPRYACALQTARLPFQVPSSTSDLVVVERMEGNTTTDFGAPSLAIACDTQPVDPVELKRFQMILEACWHTFDAAVDQAAGKALSTGPRGGGRDLIKIIDHVRDVDSTYLNKLGGSIKFDVKDDPKQALAISHQAILTTLTAAVQGEVPSFGPRGGARWTPRYFVRRLAWHELDHAWEIEDRAE
jgi:hypothetical protein